MKAREYTVRKGELMPRVLASLAQVEAKSDLILVEGAGSPAEINLRDNDIANMGFAEAADVPVVLVGDIDRGGVIASLVGTSAVLAAQERLRIKGFIVNRFRGDPELFEVGMQEIAARTGWAPLGVVPHFSAASKLPAEDVLDLRSANRPGGKVRIVVPRLPRIANFDDLDPLSAETDLEIRLLDPGEALPGDCDIVLLPGSKSTMADLNALREEGWDIDILAHHRRGGMVIGLCGGFQMLGRTISDPAGVEGPVMSMNGLGLLAVDTVLGSAKTTLPVQGIHLASGETVAGYEIHLGRTEGPDCLRPLLDIGGRRDGAVSADGRVIGTYVHGIFTADGFRRAFLETLGAISSAAYEAGVEAALDGLAAHLAEHLDLDHILTIAQSRGR